MKLPDQVTSVMAQLKGDPTNKLAEVAELLIIEDDPDIVKMW